MLHSCVLLTQTPPIPTLKWKRAVALAEAMSGFRERPTMFSTPDKVAQAIQERPGKLGEGAFGQVHKLELGAVTRAVKIVPISRNESLGLNKNGFGKSLSSPHMCSNTFLCCLFVAPFFCGS